MEKLLKHKSDTKKYFQKQIKQSKIFLSLIIKQLSIHKYHLNTYNHTNEIDIHWTLDLCVMCVNQIWTSSWSSMKFQWSIQSSYTQLARSQVTYLTSRNEYIWPHQSVYIWLKAFHLASIFHTFDQYNSIFEKRCHENFYISLMNKPLALVSYILIHFCFTFS